MRTLVFIEVFHSLQSSSLQRLFLWIERSLDKTSEEQVIDFVFWNTSPAYFYFNHQTFLSQNFSRSKSIHKSPNFLWIARRSVRSSKDCMDPTAFASTPQSDRLPGDCSVFVILLKSGLADCGSIGLRFENFLKGNFSVDEKLLLFDEENLPIYHF